ncbi:unnamed protein product [Penicillium roqueforti FM164]|uniref:Genomic scaffold, ProqFM164S04 n=1 Tax=Penicillium roqueforti (strain FM164) TaxID=1365484 RepID=W6QME7_PENRF|nr:unnamed protein product [Penicillium roqueforti FM164]
MYPTRMLRMQPTRAFAFPTPVCSFPRKCPHYLPASAPAQACAPRVAPYWYVLYVALSAAVYSCTKKLLTDKTLRLHRNSPESRDY